MLYWMRIGDEDRYHSVDTIEEVAEEFLQNNIHFVERSVLYGFTSEEFQRNNYISLFRAFDPGGPTIVEVSNEDVEILNELLGRNK